MAQLRKTGRGLESLMAQLRKMGRGLKRSTPDPPICNSSPKNWPQDGVASMCGEPATHKYTWVLLPSVFSFRCGEHKVSAEDLERYVDWTEELI